MKNKEAIIIAPIVTEKGFSAGEHNQYVFRVHPDVNKIEIKKAIEHLYKVKVAGVNTLAVKGHKKAYVTLAKGNTIEELKV